MSNLEDAADEAQRLRARLFQLEGPQTNAEPTHRRVSVPLAVAIIVFPVAFVWFLLKRGYSAFSRVAGFLWLCLWVGSILGGTFPRDVAPAESVSGADTAAPVTFAPGADQPASADQLPAEIGHFVPNGDYLAAPVAVTNQTERTLAYLELRCVFYGPDGSLTANDFTNWTNVAPGEKVSGSIGIKGVSPAQLARSECHARTSL
jgi:hypothetical protein